MPKIIERGDAYYRDEHKDQSVLQQSLSGLITTKSFNNTHLRPATPFRVGDRLPGSSAPTAFDAVGADGKTLGAFPLAERTCRIAQRVAGLLTEHLECGDSDDRYERDDQGVFNKPLTLVITEH